MKSLKVPAGHDAFDGVDTGMALAAAESAGVCIRPHVRTVTDRATGESVSVPIPCGSTREAVCPTCAVKARRLRMHQCREGWHRTDADVLPTEALASDVDEKAKDEGDVDEQLDDEDDGGQDEAEVAAGLCGPGRRVRSTRRIAGFPDLPTVPMENRTVGREFVDRRDGTKVYRPSMFLTLTSVSYGKVIEGTGVPRHPASYDYRRAALDALLWPRLLDRFWQNLRRCAGYKVQYFSAIEAQRRLAPHLHAAIRGTIPRTTVKAVVAATYYAAWWPPLDRERFTEATGWPIFDRETGGYVDPTTGVPLSTWEEATEDLHGPAHLASFGRQVDIKGLIAGSVDSDRAIRYLCKYLTKNVADTWTGQHPTNANDRTADATAAAYQRHTDRLHAEVLVLPCSSSCANWLRYGVTPENAGPGLVPGLCSSPAHDRENLGLGGRRVLVSRQMVRQDPHPTPGRPPRRRRPGARRSRHRRTRSRPARRRPDHARRHTPLRVDRLRSRRTHLRRRHRRVTAPSPSLADPVRPGQSQGRASQGRGQAGRLTTCGHLFGNRTSGMKKGAPK